MKLRKFTALLLALLTAAAVLTGCDTAADSGADTVLGSGGKTLRIVSGSENRELEPILEDFAKSEGVRIEMTYQGSLDIMRLLEGEEIPQDWCGSYADGACGLTDLNASAVASGTAQAIQDAAAALEEGSLQVFAGPLHGVAGDGEVLSLGDGDYYTENQDSSTPTFHYIVDGITVLS